VIYGIDVGMRRVAVACPERGEAWALKVPDKVDHVDAMHFISAYVGQLVPIAARVWIESVIQGGNGNVQTAVKMGMTAGAIIGALPNRQVRLVAISSWKMAVCGHGGIDKDDVRWWLDESSPALAAACEGDQDRYDATCIALYGQIWRPDQLDAPRRVRKRAQGALLRGRRPEADES
jgi:Holliday junction resolvasome RuvABC endonuclease subunit